MKDKAVDNIGKHLLGWKKPEEDPRDYKMAEFLNKGETATDDLDTALANLQKSGAAKATKAFAVAITAHVRKLEGKAPSPTPTPTGDVLWGDPDQLDQGQTGHCVGFGSAQFCNASPINDHMTNSDGHDIYYECKVIDGEPRAENGSSVHSGAKALKNRGRISTYVWASNLDDIKNWVKTKGPVIVGTDWFQNMFSPDSNGLITPTGSLAGGHCYILVGWSHDDIITAQNSWGSSWGINGRFKIKASDFQKLIVSGFEACSSVENAL